MARLGKWIGKAPSSCDACGEPVTRVFVDGKLKHGPWGILCPTCHEREGVGLGIGLGQKYSYDADSGEWVRTGG